MLDTGESEAGDLLVLEGEDLLFACDFFEEAIKGVDPGAQLVVAGVSEEFVTTVVLEADGFVLKNFVYFFETLVTHFGQFQELVLAHFLDAGHHFGQGAEAGKAGIAGAGSRWDEPSFYDGDAKAGRLFFQVIGAPKTDEAAAGDDDIGGCKKTFFFPNRQVHSAIFSCNVIKI